MFRIQYLVSLFTFYMRGEISVDNYFIRFHRPETRLGIIAAGSTDTSVPVLQISSVAKRFSINFIQLLNTLFLIALSVIVFKFIPRYFWIALILLLFAFNAFLQTFVTKLTIRFTSGQTVTVSFIVFEMTKADQAEKVINGILLQRMDPSFSSSRYGDVS